MTRQELETGWTLSLPADAPDGAVPAHVRAALPIPATVPGTVHTDLLAAGLIPDPYLDRNELTLDWIGRAPWRYERSLPPVGPDERAVLLFEGLDTVATVTVDGAVVARTENMHRRYEVPVPPGARTLAVRFDPAEAHAAAERDRVGPLPAQYPAPYNFIRKMACNFGWDWGPTLVTAGIWRPVTLVRHRGPRIREVRPRVTVEGARGTAVFDVLLDAPVTEAVRLTATVGPAGAKTEIAVGADRATVAVPVDDPRLWWPVGLGPQPLYEATVGLPSDEWRDRIGFRSVRLDTTPDADGTPFTIVVNDVAVPVRGANWIPDDCFPSRVTGDRVRHRVDQAVAANVNLLRVWGGGVYESREFYRACDERGVLVWQDFLFACAAYPEEGGLPAEVDAEARDNVARLMPHPSLVLWNGNNENVWGWFDWEWRPAIGDRPWGLGFYLDVLPRAVAETDPTRPYWPGSPYAGRPDVHPNHEDHGPSHVWDVWNQVDYAVYRRYRPRFVAEFGWQAPPAWATLTRAVADTPLAVDSPGLAHHQKAEDGQGKLNRGLLPHFAPPATFDDWLFATQLNQARAVGVGVTHFRSLRPRCAGTIVWQLNDCWPVVSWAAVDGDGRRKPMWHALRAAYTPRLLTIQPGAGGLALFAVNDAPRSWREPVTVRRLSFDGEVLAEHRGRIAAERLGVARIDLPDEVADPADPTAELLVATAGEERALWFFRPDRDLAYRPPALDASVARDGPDVLLTVSATTLTRDLCVFADRIDPGAEADDGLVTLLPGERRTVRVLRVPAGREQALTRAPVLRTANDLNGGGAR